MKELDLFYTLRVDGESLTQSIVVPLNSTIGEFKTAIIKAQENHEIQRISINSRFPQDSEPLEKYVTGNNNYNIVVIAKNSKEYDIKQEEQKFKLTAETVNIQLGKDTYTDEEIKKITPHYNAVAIANMEKIVEEHKRLMNSYKGPGMYMSTNNT